MAKFSFRLPDIGEGIAEAEIVAWHVAAGDRVDEDQPIADLMTDKATVEMSSPVAGVVLALNGAAGDQIAIGSILAEFEVAGEERAPTAEAPTQAAAETVAEAVATAPIAGAAVPEAAPPPAVAGEAPRAGAAPVLASPAVRARAKALGIALDQVRPGEGGRVRHADLDAFITYHRDRGFGSSVGGAVPADATIRLTGLRRRIAENMVAAKRHIPHFTYVEEVDVSKLEALRADLNATRGDKPKLTMLPLLVTALCRAVREFPMVNARYDEEAGAVTRHGAVHLGIATRTDAGLTVPVLRDAHALNIWQIAGEIVRLAEGARSGRLSSNELSGSTVTVTSLGPLGGIVSTPVINRPEVAILGINRVVERPVVKDGAITIARMMNLSSSFDHRVIDGWDAASFIQAIRRMLETPALLFVP